MKEHKLIRQLHHLVCMTFHILQYSTEVRRASQDMFVGYKSSPFRTCSQDYYRTCLGTTCLLLVLPLNKQRIELSDLPFQRRTVQLILHFRLEGASAMLLLPDPSTSFVRLVLWRKRVSEHGDVARINYRKIQVRIDRIRWTTPDI